MLRRRCWPCLAALLWLPFAAAAPGRILADIDVGAPNEAAAFGFGWWRAEQNAERTFRWIRFHLEADTWFSLAREAGALEVEIHAAPFFHPRRQQRLAVYLNDRFVAEWTMPHSNAWIFVPYRAKVPPGFLQPGRNRLTLRAGYIGERGYAVAVDRIRIAESPTAP